VEILTITNDRFAQGTYALMNSVLKNGGLDTPQFSIYHYGPLAKAWRDRLMGLYKCELHDIRELGEFKYNGKVWAKRIAPAIQKLLFFKLSGGKKLYVDSDILCLNKISDVEKMEPFSVAPDVGVRFNKGVNNYLYFNTGLFVFQPGIFDEIQEFALNMGAVKKLGDQLVLNKFFYSKYPERVRMLDYRWNTLRRLKTSFPASWKPDEIKMLHYVGEPKPWEKPDDREFRRLWKKYL
jgi:lipopolysaccharide biosynthesis glycosyltransferase